MSNGREAPPESADPREIAAAWTLRHRSVDGVVVGFRCPHQIDLTLARATLEPSNEDLAQINGGAR